MMDTQSHAVGLIGRGISASRSPEIHEAAARDLGLPLTYRLIDFDQIGWEDARLGEMVRLLVGLGVSGCNITYPFKQAVIAHCDTIDANAERLGAVNTLRFDNGRIVGHNTDWIGFSWLIERDIGQVANKRVAQIGAGGAGSATAYALAQMGVAELTLFDPSADRTAELIERLADEFSACTFVAAPTAKAAITGADGVVQTSPVGMASCAGQPFSPDILQSHQWLAEIIYFPAETELLAAARARGCRGTNGVAMVVGQAAEAFRLITGATPDREAMLARMLATSSCTARYEEKVA